MRRIAAAEHTPGPLLAVDACSTHFQTPAGVVRAVDDVSLTVERGRTLGIVGESGSGKSVLVHSIMGLLPRHGVVRRGSVRFEGRELMGLGVADMRSYWGAEMAMVFQDPMTSLNPVMRIGTQLTEALHQHVDIRRREATAQALALLRSVGIPDAARRMREYPHMLSGGMRQRVMIALALAGGPKILLADEPTTALDVTVQCQVLDLLQEQQRARAMAMILVSHDLGVVFSRADDVAVMYAGRIVERAPAATLRKRMHMPYTEALFRSIPTLSRPSHTRLDAIVGRPPSPTEVPTGCPFHPRCEYADDQCRAVAPPLQTAAEPTHEFACWHPVNLGVSPTTTAQTTTTQTKTTQTKTTR